MGTERQELFDERDSLMEDLKKMQSEYEERIDEVDENYLPGLNELRSRISTIRCNLVNLGVAAEDC